MANFTVQALKPNELIDAWPVVRSGPYANADWWLAEAAELIKGGGGVLVARAPDGRIHGVATFKPPALLARKKMLTIPLLISFELNRTAPARSALLKTLERIATKLDCSHVVLPLSGKPARQPSWQRFAELHC